MFHTKCHQNQKKKLRFIHFREGEEGVGEGTLILILEGGGLMKAENTIFSESVYLFL